MDTDEEIFDDEVEVISRPPLSRLKKKVPEVPREALREVLPVLSLSSEEVERKPLSRLKKKTVVSEVRLEIPQEAVVSRNRERTKPSFAEKKGNIVERYEMSKPDIPEEELYIETSEESYSAELSPSMRREMNLQDPDYLLSIALVFLKENLWNKFIHTPIMRKKLAPVMIVLESCGGGFKKTKNMKLWKLAWAGRLRVARLKTPIEDEACVSCAYDRHVNYVMYKKKENGEKFIGYMGPSCYGIRFSKILDLVNITKDAARTMVRNEYKPGTDEFEEFVKNPIEEAIDEVIEGPKEMVETIHRK